MPSAAKAQVDTVAHPAAAPSAKENEAPEAVAAQNPMPDQIGKMLETPYKEGMAASNAISGLSKALIVLAAAFLIVAAVPVALVGFSMPWSAPVFGVCLGGAVVSVISAVISRYIG
jgi:hypothetical protein